MIARCRSLILFAAVLLGALPAFAFMVVPRNLQELSQKAAVIFVGTCIKVEKDLTDKQIPVINVTYEVETVLKGDVPATYTFSQYEPMHERTSLLGWGSSQVVQTSRKWTAPDYKVGEKNILFLYPESEWGLTSTVAMGYGKFKVYDDPDTGQALVVNRFGNAGLFEKNSTAALALQTHSHPPSQDASKPIRYENFLHFVQGQVLR